VPLKRGQHIFGTPQTSDFLRIDRSRLRRKLKSLENIGFLTIKTTNRYSVATIINYDTYQPSDQPADQQDDIQTTSRRPADDQQTTTPNKDKKVKKVKKGNKTPLYPPWLDSDLWKTFKDHRQRLRAPMTQEAERRNLIKLEKLIDSNGGSPTQDEIIGQSIESGWKGLFKLKEEFIKSETSTISPVETEEERLLKKWDKVKKQK
jgi:hypothetical protein